MLPTPVETSPPILKHFIFLANRETEKAKDENRNHLLRKCMSMRGGDVTICLYDFLYDFILLEPRLIIVIALARG